MTIRPSETQENRNSCSCAKLRSCRLSASRLSVQVNSVYPEGNLIKWDGSELGRRWSFGCFRGLHSEDAAAGTNWPGGRTAVDACQSSRRPGARHPVGHVRV